MTATVAVPRCWAVIAAAGQGRRMDSHQPKQYLELMGSLVLELSLRPFLEHPGIAGVLVVLAPGDEIWPTLPAAHHPRVNTAIGGERRIHSVRNGLRALETIARTDDWILVHDAARPCLSADTLSALITSLQGEAVGGLLAAPLTDTLKRADSSGTHSQETLDRSGLWCAQTPQMFRYELLCAALDAVLESGLDATDEAAAVEALGHRPRLVRGSSRNIKITRPEDLDLATAILRSQVRE